MTYLTIEQLNNNAIYAPIGYEKEFKRRLFLDNFNRCMNIREFQKTAGCVIRQKLNTHPVAKLMKVEIERFKYENSINTCKYRQHNSFYAYWLHDWNVGKEGQGDNYFDRRERRHRILMKSLKPYYTTKKGKIVNSRAERLGELLWLWTNTIRRRVDTITENNRIFNETIHDLDNLLRIGFRKFIDIFADKICKKEKMIKHTDYWNFCDHTGRFIHKYKNFYYTQEAVYHDLQRFGMLNGIEF